MNEPVYKERHPIFLCLKHNSLAQARKAAEIARDFSEVMGPVQRIGLIRDHIVAVCDAEAPGICDEPAEFEWQVVYMMYDPADPQQQDMRDLDL